VARGVAVICLDDAARAEAKRLARVVYRDARLRPNLDEAAARVLIGNAAPSTSDLAGAVKAARRATGDVRRRLLVSVGRDVQAKLLAIVEQTPDSRSANGHTTNGHTTNGQPTVRVLDVAHGRFLSLTLRATLKKDAKGKVSRGWADAVVTLRALHGGEEPGPRRQNVRPASPSAAPEDAQESVLQSPWFWTGIGIVVAAGVTVIVLSQTIGKTSDVVAIDGQIGE
jgi:hypothetical protein